MGAPPKEKITPAALNDLVRDYRRRLDHIAGIAKRMADDKKTCMAQGMVGAANGIEALDNLITKIESKIGRF